MQAHTAYAAHAQPATERSTDAGAMPALYRAAVGPIHANRYLSFFERQDDAGRTLTNWNWAAALCTVNWMVFRQLWGAALVYLAIFEGAALLLFALGHQLLKLPRPVLGGLLLACLSAASVLPGLYGDAIFHSEIRKKIHKALSNSANLAQATSLLTQQAASRRRLEWVAGINTALFALAAGLWLAFPDGGRAALENLRAPISAGTAVPVPQRAAPSLPPSATEARPVASAAVDAARTATGLVPAPAAQPPEAPAQEDSAAARAPAASPPAPTVLIPPAVQTPVAAAMAPRPVAEQGPATPSTVPAAASPPPAAPAKTAPKGPFSTMVASKPGAGSAPPSASAGNGAATRALYINVGLFGEIENARRTHARLQKAGLPSALGKVTMHSGRQLTRVRVGPFTSTSEANSAAAKIREMGLEVATFQQ